MLLGLVGLASACTAPPPLTCSPTGQPPAAPIFDAQHPLQSLFEWLARWWWLSNHNCHPTDPDQPPAVVPESPVAVLVPLAAIATGGLGLVIVRSRRTAARGA